MGGLAACVYVVIRLGTCTFIAVCVRVCVCVCVVTCLGTTFATTLASPPPPPPPLPQTTFSGELLEKVSFFLFLPVCFVRWSSPLFQLVLLEDFRWTKAGAGGGMQWEGEGVLYVCTVVGL